VDRRTNPAVLRVTKNQKPKTKNPFKYLFGPVPSRRLGYSLGVDLFPRKTCDFNCVYCECGVTEEMVIERGEFVPFEDVANELRRFLPHEGLDFVTFSGSGEPTLYSRLGELIRIIRKLTGTRIAVITNSSLIMRPDVRSDLALADVVIPSLDAVSPDIMRRMNRSHGGIHASEMIDGLVRFRREFKGEMLLEIMFCKGINDGPDEVRALAEAAARIGPDRVQLNTVDRPPALDNALPLSLAELEKIKAAFTMHKVEIIGAFSHDQSMTDSSVSPEEQILNLLQRRPVHEDDLIMTLGLGRDQALSILNRLVGGGKIVRSIFEGRVHYQHS
jgi:wyosine [tRNA(Phe)-imidazoG37] synthetase (radical SAM superfamily)